VIRVFFENEIGSLQAFLILKIKRQTRVAKKIPNTFFKTSHKTKETTYTLIFVKYFEVSLRSHSFRAFLVFLEDSLRIISGI
jgi:hypothetical protein